MRKFLFLSGAQRFGDVALLLVRVFVGVFLIAGVWDKLTGLEDMRAYASFLAGHGFSNPSVLAPVSVYIQLLVGVAFVVGLLTRWAGVLCAVHFTVAIAMVDRFEGMHGTFPPGCLVVIGLYLATHGAGRVSLDALLRANESPRTGGGVRLKL